MTETLNDPDFFALVYIGAGSCYGRSKDRQRAIDNVIGEAKDFANVFGGFKKGTEIKVNIFDLSDSGIGRVTWGDDGVRGYPEGAEDGEPTVLTDFEVETVTLKNGSKPR